WEFVRDSMRDAFRDLFEDLEFEQAGQRLSANVILSNRRSPLPAYLMSDGWLTGLLHLCAVASGVSGSVVTIDEPENALHPHAIRSLIESSRQWARKQDLTIVLATHSPVVLNQFRGDDRERVF